MLSFMLLIKLIIIIIKHNTVVHRFEVCTRVGFFISTIYRVEVIYMNEAVFRG